MKFPTYRIVHRGLKFSPIELFGKHKLVVDSSEKDHYLPCTRCRTWIKVEEPVFSQFYQEVCAVAPQAARVRIAEEEEACTCDECQGEL